MDFVLFSSAVPNALVEEKLEGKQPPEALALLLLNARNVCWNKMFGYAPLDLGGIEKLAFSYGKPKSISDLVSILSSVKPGVLEGQLRPFIKIKMPSVETIKAEGLKKPKGDPVDFAFAFFLFCLWRSVFPESVSFAQKGRPSKKEVRFAANQPGWVLVKKVDLGKAEEKEVLLGLAGVFASANKKLADFTVQDAEAFESFVSSFLNSFPVRKSFVKLSALLGEALKKEHEISAFAGGDARKLGILEHAFFLRCFEHAGFPPFVSLDAIAGVYPGLKIPKPRGNFGGKKKK